jgi:protocatechuate 3,4-dioxygenase, alpha subunit
MLPLRQTPSQTVGPFFGVGLTRAGQSQSVMVNDLTEGERIRIEGTVFDGSGATIEDALVEVWQANAHGRYRHELDSGPAPLDPNFFGFGRCPTAANGVFHFETIKPGAIHDGDPRPHAPHLNVAVFARGMLVHAFTRMYFDADPLEGDPTLALVDRDRRATLIGVRAGQDGGRAIYRWDIHLQGDRETVFFDA